VNVVLAGSGCPALGVGVWVLLGSFQQMLIIPLDEGCVVLCVMDLAVRAVLSVMVQGTLVLSTHFSILVGKMNI
jgi:hypothetical protein